MVHASAPAGWYPQPDNTMRYWDGTEWTEHVHAPGPAQRMTYEGIRWLGVHWGKSGKPQIHRIAAVLFMLFAGVQLLVATRASVALWPLVMSGLFALAAITYWIEAHFAARVVREQQPQPRKPRGRKSLARTSRSSPSAYSDVSPISASSSA